MYVKKYLKYKTKYLTLKNIILSSGLIYQHNSNDIDLYIKNQQQYNHINVSSQNKFEENNKMITYKQLLTHV